MDPDLQIKGWGGGGEGVGRGGGWGSGGQSNHETGGPDHNFFFVQKKRGPAGKNTN